MLTELANFYLSQPEPNRSYMLALQKFILNYSPLFEEKWKYKLPFFYYKNKAFCYIWKDSKTQQPYLGIVKAARSNYPKLIQGNRKKIKILPLNPQQDLPVDTLHTIFKELMVLY